MTTEAQKRASREWKKRNPDAVRASNARCAKRYYEKNKKRLIEKARQYYMTEKGKSVALKAGRKWRENNKELASKLCMVSREKKREQYNQNAKEYQRRPEVRAKHQVYVLNRLAKLRGISDNSVTPESIKSIFYKQKGLCAISGECITTGYHIDHIIPISRGGKHIISNIQLLKPSVNLRKSNKLEYAYVG